jgi:hypothetical protein
MLTDDSIDKKKRQHKYDRSNQQAAFSFSFTFFFFSINLTEGGMMKRPHAIAPAAAAAAERQLEREEESIVEMMKTKGRDILREPESSSERKKKVHFKCPCLPKRNWK